MGVVDFDPEKWRQTNVSETPASIAKVAKAAEVDAYWAKLSQVSQLPQVAPLPLPTALRDGLSLLCSMRTPCLAEPDRWPVAVSDALRLAREGWAAWSLALGWSPLDLFGATRDRDGYADTDGLVVWLGGRRVLVICATYASVRNEIGRAYFNRSTRLGTTLLWDIGKDAKG